MAALVETSGIAFQQTAFPPMPVCRLSVEMYEEMIRSGIIMEDDAIELLDGWMVPKMTQNPPHILAAEMVRDALHDNVPAGWSVYSGKPIRVGISVPEPDAMVVRGQRQQFRDRRIQAQDVRLIVEVADTSLWRDKEFKKTIYAQAGIPVYWLVNLIDNRIEVYSGATGTDEKADYQQRHDYGPGDQIPLTLDGQQIATLSARDMLP
ncbi:MAG: Uma2 family endonuclease [Thermoguttaceae bacterium]